MNSRDRVLAALAHEQPDQVPISFGDHRSGGITALAYVRLRDYLGLPQKPVRVYDFMQMLAVVDEDVLQFFGTDSVALDRAFAEQDGIWHEWELSDGTPCLIPAWIQPERKGDGWLLRDLSGRPIARNPAGAPYFDHIYFPLADARLPKDKAALADLLAASMEGGFSAPGPGVTAAQTVAGDVEIARRLRARSERAIIGVFGGSLLELGNHLFRHDNFYMMLASEPEKVHAVLRCLTDHHLQELEQFLRHFGPYIDMILFGDDLGMQRGPLLSPRMYRELFKPYHQEMWQRAKELAQVKVLLHSCGSIRAYLPDLIEAGVDAINPVQISAQGMDATALKRDFGDRITFWGGGCDTQQVLPFGTPDEIRQHVRQQVEILAPDGGFVFSQVHNIQDDVPPENIVAMVEAVHACR
ncbi:MAG: uroporphyrinogen decarboxylase family protein [Anaerolineae bacterium]|nr:uroporphyrinogen decarboxylase family protein [Anaerolineae bacterium]